MHGTAFADESAAELLQYPIGLTQRAPKAPCSFGIERKLRPVLAEGDRTRDLARIVADDDRHAQIGKRGHDGAVKFRDALRYQGELPARAIAHADVEHARIEIELHLEVARSVRNRRAGQSLRGDIQRHVPAVIQPRRLCKADLADNLRPKVQSGTCILPGMVIELRPVRRCDHGSILLWRYTMQGAC